ncbi:uncharacterized protein LOC129296440 [Prosopis cineraria]|uniref:uncharacterized protein LOC129296440 n=1 Tax=Prosopis cineraria TaxID=364024 RepID=UPI002410B4A1|nr:uncharacterized protein LOC129296440 [Prosopis cineraria]
MEFVMSLGDMLVKVALFFLVQALVYLILSNSSNIFSNTVTRSTTFRTARSASIRRILAVLSDQPIEAEPSPSSRSPPSPAVQNYKSE